MSKSLFIRVSRPTALLVFVALGVVALCRSEPTMAVEKSPPSSPSHQVIACYFHRTVRCDTCKKISAYIDEAVKTGFAAQVKEGEVKMVMVDFQDEKNKRLTQAYKIAGPTLVIMDVRDGQTTEWKTAPKVWSLVGKKDDFFKYVQTEMQNYIDGKKPQANAPAK
jgi:hypothetical protein